MSKKVVWLIASYLIVVMLVVASCGIAVVEEEEVVQEPPATETPAPTPPGPETVIFPDENLEAAEKEGTVTPAVTEVEVGKSRSNPVLFGQSLTYQNKRVTVLNSE